jgi:hypothetical protein
MHYVFLCKTLTKHLRNGCTPHSLPTSYTRTMLRHTAFEADLHVSSWHQLIECLQVLSLPVLTLG